MSEQAHAEASYSQAADQTSGAQAAGEQSADRPDGAQSHPHVESTGDARVDAAVERLHELDHRPTSEHVEVYDDVHRRLQDALADLDGS